MMIRIIAACTLVAGLAACGQTPIQREFMGALAGCRAGIEADCNEAKLLMELNSMPIGYSPAAALANESAALLNRGNSTFRANCVTTTTGPFSNMNCY